MPSGRLRTIAYSPKRGVEWSTRWQDTLDEPLEKAISTIVEKRQGSHDHFLNLMIAEDVAEAKRKKGGEEEWERDERREDARKVAQALAESQQQLVETIEKWGKRWLSHAFSRMQRSGWSI